MTISNQNCSVTYSGDGSTTVWNYNFLIPFQDDGVTPAVKVTTNLNGVDTDLTLGVDFTITAVGNPSGGTVVISPALPNDGTTVTILRALDYVQGTAVPNQSFYPNTVEMTADTIVEQIQQIRDTLGHCVRLSRTQESPAGISQGPALRANKIIGFGGAGHLGLFDNPSLDFTLLNQMAATNVFSFIPTGEILNIIAGTPAIDVSQYLNEAHASAGIGGRVYYPAGTYMCSRVTYLDGQSIFGAGATSTILTKSGIAGSENHEMLVGFNWINDIPLLHMQGLTVQDMGFATDNTSTGGYAIVNFANRSRIQNNNILAKTTGDFGGVRMATYTHNGTPITNAGGGANGIHFHNNLIQNCTLGGIVGLTTFITAVNPNVSITVSKSTFGPGGANSYTDSDSNTVFTGTSNGTTTILVANTTGLGVGDEIEGPDISTDFNGDIYLHMNIISGCGSLDGTSIGSIDSRGMAGWIIVQNKLENSPGPLLNCQSGAHSCLIANNLFDYKCTSGVGPNFCCNLGCDTNGRNLVACNQFKSTNIQDPSKAYTILNFFPKHQASHMNIASNNFFDIPATQSGTFIAFNVTTPATLLGSACGNAYDPLMTAAQRGNGDAVWAPTLTPGVAPPSPAIGWTMPYVDVADGAMKVKKSDGTVKQLAP